MSELAVARATRIELQRVATHVLARRRYDVTGRFGLRATPGGFGTPAFGPPDAVEVLRVAGTTLVREVGGDVTTCALPGATLQELADFGGTDLGAPFEAGHDTPPMGDPAAVLAIEPDAAVEVAAWFDLGWRILDAVVADAADPTTVQLWPEHFDAGCSVATGPGPNDRTNLGASPGDAFSEEPYLYLGPWGSERPGDRCHWNAPFGAVLRRSEVASPADGIEFLARGLAFLAGAG